MIGDKGMRTETRRGVSGMYSGLALRYRRPMLAHLDEAGCRRYFRECDLTARYWLNDAIIPEFDAKNFEACSMLVHAERYLADRLSYELAPWPKGLIKLETEQDYALPKVTEHARGR